MSLSLDRDGLAQVLHPLAVVLGVGLDARMGDMLLLSPVLWTQQIDRDGTRVWAGGRTALAPHDSWGVAAAVVLAAEMCSAGEELAYASAVVAAGLSMQAARVTHSHPLLRSEGASGEVDRAIRAVASVLLSGGWVVDLREEVSP